MGNRLDLDEASGSGADLAPFLPAHIIGGAMGFELAPLPSSDGSTVGGESVSTEGADMPSSEATGAPPSSIGSASAETLVLGGRRRPSRWISGGDTAASISTGHHGVLMPWRCVGLELPRWLEVRGMPSIISACVSQ